MTVSSALTIAAMQAVRSPHASDVIEVAGYRSSHDGGGGTFFFDTTGITQATVSSARITNAAFDPSHPLSPIVITAVAHPFVDGQAVLVQGVGGNTNANGVWLIHLPLRPPGNVPDPDTFVLLGSRSNAPYTSGGTATSVTVTTSAAHGLAPGGRATIERVTGMDGFSLNGSYMPIGTATPTTFTLAFAPTGSYSRGGAVGDRGVSFPSTKTDGRWVRRRDGAEINVKWFGAVGKGDADDTEPLIATIRAARVLKAGVYVPSGTFKTNAEIKLETYGEIVAVFTDTGLSIRGEGSEEDVHSGTQLTAGQAMRSILSVRAGGVTIKGVRFECAAKADHGLYLQGAAHLHLDDVNVLNARKDGYRVVSSSDDGQLTINDSIYARKLSATKCGTMYCSESIASRYTGFAREVIKVPGTVSCTAGNPPNLKITGLNTKFKSIPARPGDFILIGAEDESKQQRLEITSIDCDTEITVGGFGPPSLNLSGQPFAIGVGDGWSEEVHNDNNLARMDTGFFIDIAGSGIVCRGLYGPLLEHQEFQFCGFAGIVIGTLDNRSIISFSTRISNPYFEGDFSAGPGSFSFFGGCILLAQARGITIDQPMWNGYPPPSPFGHQRHRQPQLRHYWLSGRLPHRLPHRPLPPRVYHDERYTHQERQGLDDPRNARTAADRGGVRNRLESI